MGNRYQSWVGAAAAIALASCSSMSMGNATHSSNRAPSSDANLGVEVTDPSGAVVPAAVVTVTNVDTSAVQSGKSDNSGLAKFSLPAGNYNIKVESPGFKVINFTNKEVGASSTTVAATLEVGTSSPVVIDASFPLSSDAVKYGIKPKAFNDLLKEGRIVLTDGQHNLDQICGGGLDQSEGSSTIDFGSFVVAPNETFSFGLQCTLYATGTGTDKPAHFQITPLVTHSIMKDVNSYNVNSMVLGFTLMEGESGEYVEQIDSWDADGAMVEPGDKDPSSTADVLKVRRRWKEFWLVVEVRDGTNSDRTLMAEHLYIKLGHEGVWANRTIVQKNRFDATVPAIDIARSKFPTADDATLSDKAKNYISGIVLRMSREASQRSCALLIDPGSLGDCLSSTADLSDFSMNSKTHRRMFAYPFGDRMYSSIGLSLGWTKSPSNNPDTWVNNRTDFNATVKEVMNDPKLGGRPVSEYMPTVDGKKPTDAQAAKWISDAKTMVIKALGDTE